ncbi:hypothetical protein LCGC14_2809200, partial [marine sediment metagenome]
IGTDISGEDSASSGINNSFGVCHATGSDAGGWTFVQRCMGWASDHGNNDGSPSFIPSDEHVLDILTETGVGDWALEVTALDHSPAQWTVTTRDAGAGAGMEVYSLALDLDNRKAKVGTVNGPTGGGGTWTPSVALGFTPQYVGLMVFEIGVTVNVIKTDLQGGFCGISSNTGSGEETCHSWYNEDAAATTNTNNLFRSRAVDLRLDDVSGVRWDVQHSSFNDGDWTYNVNTDSTTNAWFFWTIEEVAAAGETIVAAQGSYSLNGQVATGIWDHKMVAAQGDYTQTGFAAITSKGFKMVAAQGSYAKTGFAAITSRTHIMVGAQGSYLLNGQVTNLLWNHLVNTAQGNYLLTGFTAILSRQVTIIGAQGSYTLTGFAADLLFNPLMIGAQGGYNLTGIAADTRVGFTM